MMGSGETSPTMVTPHQNILKSLRQNSTRLILDTPYGFQTNADDLTSRIMRYFEINVGFPATAINFRNTSQFNNEDIATADWVFSGPGSPTYALKVWKESNTGDAFRELLSRGSLVLSSAAAISMGSHALPVYEIYKVGEEPFWLEGLNILESATGLKAAVIPHYNNAEGGSHDTSCCFVGEKRMQKLENQLPDDVFILGIDEHTGVEFDLDEDVARVFGRGALTIRMNGAQWQVASGEKVSYEEIIAHTGTRLGAVEIEEIAREVERQSPVEPFVELLLTLRDEARNKGDFQTSDRIRKELNEMGIEVRDSAKKME